MDLQAELVAWGHHRLPPVDFLIAAIAESHGLTILHHEKDFDIIPARTTIAVTSEWRAPPAMLD